MGFVPIAAGHSTAKHQKSVIDLLRERHAVSRGAAQPLPNLSSWQRRRVETWSTAALSVSLHGIGITSTWTHCKSGTRASGRWPSALRWSRPAWLPRLP
jgi:hypothetical protein